MNNANEMLLGQQINETIDCLSEINDDKNSSGNVQNYNHQIYSSDINENEKRWSLDFSMWHSVGSVSVLPKMNGENESVLRTHSEQHLRSEVELVYSLLSFSDDKEDIAKTFLAMSSSPQSCATIRQLGCMPLLVQLIHNPEESKIVRYHAHQAIRNIVHFHPDDKQGRREMRVLKLIEFLMDYCNDGIEKDKSHQDMLSGRSTELKKTQENHPGPIIAALMKLSFDEEHRHAMCQLGVLQVIAKLIEKDHQLHGDVNILDDDSESITLRRYAGMSLTNLTFGDSKNKALLCSLKPFMSILISQLEAHNEDLCQVTASVLRNLSWRADTVSKQTLRELGAVTALMRTALRVKNESTLKAVLSALWNFSAHCNLNKIDICSVEGAIEYLVKMLTYEAPSKTLLIVENAGGILRNISSIIAVRDDYRNILRSNGCLQILVNQLKSPSLTVVSNACGTLWNLSARNATDQRTLWQLGAVPMLRSLTHSKHKMISVGSSAALKNLLSSRPDSELFDRNNKGLPSLLVRKKRALEQELDSSLSETCDNIEQLESWDSFTFSFASSTTSNSENGREIKSKEYSADKASDAVSPNSDCCLKDSKNNESPRMLNEPSSNGDYSTRKSTSYDEEQSGYGDYAETDLDQPTNYSLKYGSEQDTIKTYYTEGTPHNFSSSNSMLDLRQAIVGTDNSHSLTTRIKHDSTIVSVSTVVAPKESKSSAATTTLGTPMMFSRSSSLGSLSSCCEPADDRSSVVSEFSRAASGMISPSELPDSPSQTVPPSPRPSIKPKNSASKTTAVTTLKEEEEELPAGTVAATAESLCSRNSFFDDSIKIFKDENTPLHFSTATSLSSLTFDEDAVHSVTVLPAVDEQLECSLSKMAIEEKKVSTKNLFEDEDNRDEEAFIEDESCIVDDDLSLEEQRAMLDACIKSAICNSTSKLTTATTNYQTKGTGFTEIRPTITTATITYQPIRPNNRNYNKNNNVNNSSSRSNSNNNNRSNNNNNNNNNNSSNSNNIASPTSSINEDSTVNFCTEDTPANISHAASNSDLSILCPSEDSFLLQDSILPLSSCNDDIEQLSLDEQKKLLHQCIKSGVKTLNGKRASAEKDIEDTTIIKELSSLTVNGVDELPIHEQKSLLKKCILAGINNVTASNDHHSPEKSGSSFLNSELVFPPSLPPDDEGKSLLKQCIAYGIRNLRDISCGDLENVEPPSFLAEANLENSLTNIDSITSEIADSPTVSVLEDITLTEDIVLSTTTAAVIGENLEIKERHTPKQKRRQIRNRYSTYTINTNQETLLAKSNHSPSNVNGGVANVGEEDVFKAIKPRKSFMIKERRTLNKDRFKTRTLSEGDFDDLAAFETGKRNDLEAQNSALSVTAGSSSMTSSSSSSQLPNGATTTNDGTSGTTSSNYAESDAESNDEQTSTIKAKVIKPLAVKSGGASTQRIRTAASGSNIPKPKSSQLRSISTPAAVKSKIPTKLPSALQRQGTFTKDDSTPTTPVAPLKSPVRKCATTVKLTDDSSKLFTATDPPINTNRTVNSNSSLLKNSKIRSSCYGGVSKSADVRNRWSISDNSINTTIVPFKSGSSSNLHSTSALHANSNAAFTSKGNCATPVQSQQQLSAKKEVTSKIAGLWKKTKVSKITK